MYARLLAIVCLSSIGLGVGLSEPVPSGKRPVVVYAKGGGSTDALQAPQFQQELADVMAPAGYSVQVTAAEATGGTSVDNAERLVVLTLHGSCQAGGPASSMPSGSRASLASSAVVDGHVLPFVTIECDVLNSVLGPASTFLPTAFRNKLYQRSLARILAHELYHVLADEVEHPEAGVSKPCFGVADLLSKRLEFDEPALRKLKPQVPLSSRARSRPSQKTAVESPL